MPYSEQQVLTQLESVFGGLSCIAAGRGSGAQGQQISVVLDQPIAPRRSVSAECFTPCPPPNVLVVKTNAGKWYAIGSNIGTPTNTQVSQNRRSASPPQPATLETFMLFYQQDLVTTSSGFVYPDSEVRLYAKINQQRLKYLATSSRPYADPSDGDSRVCCVPVRPGLYVVQISYGDVNGNNFLDTFLIRSGQVAQHFFYESPNPRTSLPYPSSWSSYIPYLLPTFVIGGIPEYLPPIYVQAVLDFIEPRDFGACVFDRKLQIIAQPRFLNTWHTILRRNRYQLSGQPTTSLLSLNAADLEVLGLSFDTPLGSIGVTTPSPYTIRDILEADLIEQVVNAGVFNSNAVSSVLTSFCNVIQAGNKFTCLPLIRAIPSR